MRLFSPHSTDHGLVVTTGTARAVVSRAQSMSSVFDVEEFRQAHLERDELRFRQARQWNAAHILRLTRQWPCDHTREEQHCNPTQHAANPHLSQPKKTSQSRKPFIELHLREAIQCVIGNKCVCPIFLVPFFSSVFRSGSPAPGSRPCRCGASPHRVMQLHP